MTVVTDDDHCEHEVFMKVADGRELSVEGLMNEMLGSLLAGDLSLPMVQPLFVDIDDAFTRSVADDGIRERLSTSCRTAFATVAAGSQWRGWNSTDRIAASQMQLALSILAFDCFVANPDRRPSNPNLLVKGSEWRLIDHEAAFGFRMKLFPTCAPWQQGNLTAIRRVGTDSEHLFASRLARADALNYDDIRAKWIDLSNERLIAYDALLPDEWAATRPFLTDALIHLKRVRDNIDACLGELRRVLS